MIVTDLQWFNEDYWYGLDLEELTDCPDISELFGYSVDCTYVRTDDDVVWWWNDPRILPEYMKRFMKITNLEQIPMDTSQKLEKYKKSKKKKH